MTRRKTLVSTTGFWIFPFNRTKDGVFRQLAEALPGEYSRVSDQTLDLIATFEVEPGDYDIWVGVGPNPVEVQQSAPTGTATIEPGERLKAVAHIHISLPGERSV